MTFAERVRSERNERGLGIRAAAIEAGVSPATFSRVENGGMPDVQTFAALIAWADIDPHWALYVISNA